MKKEEEEKFVKSVKNNIPERRGKKKRGERGRGKKACPAETRCGRGGSGERNEQAQWQWQWQQQGKKHEEDKFV